MMNEASTTGYKGRDLGRMEEAPGFAVGDRKAGRWVVRLPRRVRANAGVLRSLRSLEDGDEERATAKAKADPYGMTTRKATATTVAAKAFTLWGVGGW
jgi:hypothetical protein